MSFHTKFETSALVESQLYSNFTLNSANPIPSACLGGLLYGYVYVSSIRLAVDSEPSEATRWLPARDY